MRPQPRTHALPLLLCLAAVVATFTSCNDRKSDAPRLLVAPVVEPANGTGDVEPDAAIRVVFAEPMDASTLTADACTLRSEYGEIELTSVYDADIRTWTLTPVRRTVLGGRHEFRIATSVRSADGRSPAAEIATAFTVRSGRWQVGAVPTMSSSIVRAVVLRDGTPLVFSQVGTGIGIAGADADLRWTQPQTLSGATLVDVAATDAGTAVLLCLRDGGATLAVVEVDRLRMGEPRIVSTLAPGTLVSPSYLRVAPGIGHLVVWSESATSPSRTITRVMVPWQTPPGGFRFPYFPLHSETALLATWPNVVVDPSGLVCGAHFEPEGLSLSRYLPTSGAPTEHTFLGLPVSTIPVSTAGDANGRIVVGCQVVDGADVVLVARRSAEFATFEPVREVRRAPRLTSEAFHVTPGGDGIWTWREADDGQWFANFDGATGTFSAPEPLPMATPSRPGVFAFDVAGPGVSIGLDAAFGSPFLQLIAWPWHPETGFAAPEVVPESIPLGSPIAPPTVAVDASGRAAVVWRQRSGLGNAEVLRIALRR